MKRIFQKIFEFDFKTFLEQHPRLFKALSSFTIFFLILSLIFTFFDLIADNASAYTNLLREKGVHLDKMAFDLSNASHLFYISIAGIFLLYGVVLSLLDFLWIKRSGKMKKFLPIFFAHLTSSLLLFFVIDLIFELFQTPIKAAFYQFAEILSSNAEGNDPLTASLYQINEGLEQHTFIIDYIFAEINNLINSHVPTLVYTTPLISFFITILIGSFFEYGVHWLDHKSRFLWLVNHRVHHTPEHMHPMGMGVVDVFPKLFVGIPKVFLFATISKLFHQTAIFEYFLVFYILYIFTQYFNHSTFYYNFFSKRPVLSMFLFLPHSNGTIHYMHHSALEGDDAVNLSSGGFCFWDFVFGTFRMPYKDRPPVGLTNCPPIKLNPVSLLFAGWQQLFYEWKHNKNWKVRFKIIFGDIWYMPPVTKDFLKISGKVE